jgi:chemotaxis protein histidine kinase CheA
VQGQSLAIPERHVAGVEEVMASQIQRVGSQPAILHRNAFLPIYHLGALLGMTEEPSSLDSFPIVVVSNGHYAIGLAVDRLRRRQELFLKDLHPKLAAFPAIGGASVLGDGQVVLILDADGLIQLAKRSVKRAGNGLLSVPAPLPAAVH